jgi:DNA (cytosine-5)-methyltransferase 1
MRHKIRAADLFCGAGGTSTGLYLACRELGLDLELLAINHWDIAIATHSKNHPGAQHLCANLDTVDPCKVVPGGRLDLLVASPECTHHSRARGGRPRSDQSRASAWFILRWASSLYIPTILIENVPEFTSYGPLGANGKPLKRYKGQTYLAFINALQSLGYNVEARILNAANYGDPTTRERLFIIARRGRRPTWPEPTHCRTDQDTLFGNLPRWRPAREIIDWTLPGASIFNRKKSLSENTMRRIFAGLLKFGGLSFVLPNEGYYRGNAPRSVDEPLPTITQRGAGAVVEPFILNVRGGDDGYTRASSIDEPLPTVTTSAPTALVEPFLMTMEHGRSRHDRMWPVDRPMPTITSADAWAVVEPYLVKMYGGHDSCSLDDPLPTVTANYEHFGLAEPFLVQYHSTGGPQSVDEPLPTQTTKDRFGLVVALTNGQQAILDIRFRMLQPHELAAAMSFPKGYEFAGNREERVRQIGNAVPVELARALCLAQLEASVGRRHHIEKMD